MANLKVLKKVEGLAVEEPNLLHIQESYLRQRAHAHPKTANKKSKSDVRATGAKWFRQKGTGRARQGEVTNPHLHGGGLAFAPKPRKPQKRLNRRIRRSALHSAVKLHLDNKSAFVLGGAGFKEIAKTKEVHELLVGKCGYEPVLLVLDEGNILWRAARNLGYARIVKPEFVNVRDLVESSFVVFDEDALVRFELHLQAANSAYEKTAAPEAVAVETEIAGEPAGESE
jgi:large subunit ribosomal protein L4